jgi:hypothetical protein
MSTLLCTVCGDAVFGYRQTGSVPVCSSSVCQGVLAQQANMTPSAFAHYLKFRSQDVREKRRLNEVRQARLQLAREREQTENLVYAKASLGPDVTATLSSHVVLAVPSCRRSITPLPQRRRAKFRDFLNQLITRTLQTKLSGRFLSKSLPEEPPASLPLLEKSCALCAGACCLAGAEHAFLDEDSLARVMRQHPAWRPRDLLQVYTNALPTRTYSQSCVFHTSKGCALPRDLRSHVCWTYFCEALAGYQDNALANGGKRVIVIVRAREIWDFPDGKDDGIEAAVHLQANGDAV